MPRTTTEANPGVDFDSGHDALHAGIRADQSRRHAVFIPVGGEALPAACAILFKPGRRPGPGLPGLGSTSPTFIISYRHPHEQRSGLYAVCWIILQRLRL